MPSRDPNLYQQQQLRGEQDARILELTGDYDDFDGLVGHGLIDDGDAPSPRGLDGSG